MRQSGDTMCNETYRGTLDPGEIERFILSNCATASLELTAEHFSCHPNSINRLLKRERGTTFRETLAQARAERAKELLAGGATVEQVAKACGYSSLSHFYRTFGRQCGVTPGAWKHRPHDEGAPAARS